MQLGMIGLGRMGANMVRRLLKARHQCVVFDRSPKVVEELVKEKAVGTSCLQGLVRATMVFLGWWVSKNSTLRGCPIWSEWRYED